MRIGVVLLPELDWAADRHRWRRAEAYGFDHAWVYDHLAWRSLADGPWHATVPTIAGAFLATQSLCIGTLVTTPNFRHPVTLAKELMTLDVMSGGRLSIAVGAGAPGYDAAVLGHELLAPAQRHRRFVEFVGLLDSLLTQPVTSVRGEFYNAVDARMLPGPIQKPRPPIVIAANGPQGMMLSLTSARREGDGWVTLGPQDAATSDADYWTAVRAAVARMDALVDEHGAVAGFRRLLYLGSRASTTRSLEHVRDHVGRASDLGFTDVAMAWPRQSEPFCAPETLLDDVAGDLDALRRD